MTQMHLEARSRRYSGVKNNNKPKRGERNVLNVYYVRCNRFGGILNAAQHFETRLKRTCWNEKYLF